MVRTLLIATVVSLSIVPLVFSQEPGQAPPPDADRQLAAEDWWKELPSPPAGGERRQILVVPDVPGTPGVWTCLTRPGLAQPGARAARSQDGCDLGRELSRLEPCTRPEDCRALDLWTRGIGPPSLQQARPPAEVPRRGIVLTRRSPDPAAASEGSEDSEDEP